MTSTNMYNIHIYYTLLRHVRHLREGVVICRNVAFDSHQVLSKWSSASKSQVAQGFSRFGRSYWRRKVKGGVRVVSCVVQPIGTVLFPKLTKPVFQIGSPVHRFSSFGDSIHQPDRLTDVFHFKWIQRSRVGEMCWCVLVSTQRIDTGHLLFLPIIMEVEKMAIYLKGNYCWRLGVLSSMIHGRIRGTWATNCTHPMAGDQSVPKSGQKGGVLKG